ncbi:AAA-domain-containing protein [Nadsonia fulvescens var. elongata DSM 6958]|uniref:AAA-domain-containing protein n=1 Tax=Nadsonia fulvescens var. elongata DSM 6958 TaxID=857566 RepID=A0A1E3PSP6_9ASCO|nr:AAA-domain-containing protein [Nadsonia fulvescens var. elongata DSM 6958]
MAKPQRPATPAPPVTIAELVGQDRQVFDHIVQHLVPSEPGSKNDECEDTALSLASELSAFDMMKTIQDLDPVFRKQKRLALLEVVGRVLKLMTTEHKQKEIDRKNKSSTTDTTEEVDSDFDGVEVASLMEVSETNTMNKSVVNVWNIAPVETVTANTANITPAASTPTAASPALSTLPSVEEPVEKRGPKTKKRPSKDAAGGTAKRQKADKSEYRSQSSVTLADLGGIEPVINDVLELIGMPLLHPEVYTHTGISPPRGVLLHGPPGCGKTMLANALANELGIPFISISAPSVVSGMSGESEKKIREIFDEAKSLAPCLLFMDEIDAITPKRDSVAREMERRIVAQLLTSMDDVSLEKTGGKPVLIIGATNRPDSLDPALRRAGRFDREICMSVPTEDSRELILQTMCRKLRLEGDFDYKRLAKLTPGYVAADLGALTGAAGVCAIKRIFRHLTVDTVSTDRAIDGGVVDGAIDGVDKGVEAMDIDISESVTPASNTELTAPGSSFSSLLNTADPSRPVSVIQQFLRNHPNQLTPTQLAPLSITLADFLTALPTVQPSSKREGFATVPDVAWTDVGALSTIRTELQMAIVQPIKRPELYKSVGISAPAGVLLWGPPGCGKTLLAKAVANESRANFISVRGPELLNKFVGESERAVRQVFTRARASVPCVIFFDELDALVPRRDDSLSESSARVVNTLLTELDGLNERNGVYVIAATNRPDIIDPAMLRPGRLDKPLYVELPTAAERFEILKTVTRKTPLGPDVNLQALANDIKARNFSGADLAALAREAAVVALRAAVFCDIQNHNEDVFMPDDQIAKMTVSMENFQLAFRNVKPSVGDKDRAKYERLKGRLGWDDTIESARQARQAAKEARANGSDDKPESGNPEEPALAT